jgi:hypothetical protein
VWLGRVGGQAHGREDLLDGAAPNDRADDVHPARAFRAL